MISHSCTRDVFDADWFTKHCTFNKNLKKKTGITEKCHFIRELFYGFDY